MKNKGWKFKLFTMSMALLLLAVLLFSISSQAAGNNAVSISTPITGIGPAEIKQVAGNQALINIDQFPQGGSPGDPMLPYKTLSLLVPPDTDLKKVKAKLAFGKWEELPGEYEIAPAPAAATSNQGKSIISWGGKDPSRIINGRDTAIYGKNAYFPAETVQIESVGMFRQWKIVEVRVWLAVYNPVAKKVRVVSEPQITLTAEKLPAGQAVGLNSVILPRFPKTEKFLPALKSKIANTQDIDMFYGQQTAPAQSGGPAPGLIPADYVIITTSTIVANSTQLVNFVAAKTTAGFTVKTVTEGAAPETDTTYITGATADQQANNIRNWLVNHYIGDGIQYVLLIGDPHPTAALTNYSVPMKWCWPRSGQPSDDQAPTDMYFAELSGTWDLDSDTKYGEFVGDYGAGGADKNCELKVGRIPVYNANYTDLDNILSKSISYDANTSASAWRSKVLIPAAISNWQPQDDSPYDGIDDYSWGKTYGDDWGQAIKTLANSVSFSPYTLYEKTGVAFPATACNAALNNANVKSEWQNLYGFVTWWGHGSQTGAFRRVWNIDNYGGGADGWTQCPAETSDIAFFSSGDCASLDNNNSSFVVQVSCNNGWPENSSNLGYSLLKNGAIGTISGTRVTWYAIGSWNTGIGPANGDNASYGYYCFDRMANSAEDIGTALVYCRGNFGTGWAGGESWMNMIEFSLYGDPSLDLDITGIGPKWEQPPDTSENGVDIRCDRKDQIPRLLADDFNCTQTGPITKVTIWGSWKDDKKGVIDSIHLSIHSDKPDPDGSEGPEYSEPNELLWSRDFSSAEFTEIPIDKYVEEWWWDPYMQMTPYWPGDHQIWQYDINIPYYEAFVQQGDPNHPIVYWLDAYVDINMIESPPEAEFGWKTSSQHWNDDAVRWDNENSEWAELRYPSPHPYCPNSVDLAFAIDTGELPVQGHLKWSQPPIETYPASTTITYCGWDETSYNRDPCAQGPWKIVADDFRCLGSMPITSIHWWGSYYNWGDEGMPQGSLPLGWHIGFWSNVPANTPPQNLPYSYPNMLLHSFTVPASRVSIEQVGMDEYNGYYPSDTCFKYSINLEPNEIFWQDDFNLVTQDNIYWLSITADYNNQPTPSYPWGWKTRPWHWMDDAVRFNIPNEPLPYQVIDPLLINPIKEPQFQESVDMSFELDTDPNYIKWEQEFTGIRDWPHYEDVNSTVSSTEVNNRIVADDWRCVRRTPVTAVVWWGSYLGYQYQACGTWLMPIPVQPDKFLLKIWTDVPAPQGDMTIAAGSTDNSIYVYDKAGNLLWSYDTGYDVLSVAVSDDGAYVAAGASDSSNGKLYLFARDGTKLWEKDLVVQSSGGGWMGTESKSVAIAADGSYVAAGCSDGLYVYNKDGSLHWTHTGRETCVAISGNYIAACENGGDLNLFTMSSSTPLWTDSTINFFWVATSDSGYVIASDNSSTIYLYDSAGTQIWSYSNAVWSGDYIRVDMSQDGLSLVAVNDDPGDTQGCVLCYMNDNVDGIPGWSATDNTPVWSFAPGGSGSDFYSVAIAENGGYIATGPAGGSYVFSKSSNVPLQTMNMKTANSYDLTNDGKYGVCGNREGELYLFNKDSGTPIWMKTMAEKVHTVAIAQCYSHPGNPIWEYTTNNYDEVLVGYDKHPEQEQPIRSEPEFRYSVRLPEDKWFRQPDYDRVFWLSIQAVYETTQPNYRWGWTNHWHVFNDDAVSGYFDEESEKWIWTELYDQTDTSEDMSFVLFTDPNICSTCANYNCDSIVNFLDFSDFADNWLAILPPGGYDNSDLNCDGIVDWYDVKAFALQWLTKCP
jgi:hypothetical protein